MLRTLRVRSQCLRLMSSRWRDQKIEIMAITQHQLRSFLRKLPVNLRVKLLKLL
jgi:hypothetical protein